VVHVADTCDVSTEVPGLQTTRSTHEFTDV
jgi:hypothetical protein